MRVNKPRLVMVEHGHDQQKQSRLAVFSPRQAQQQGKELAAEKARKAKAPAVAGTWLDGSAGTNLASLLHQAGLVVDQTTLGIDETIDPVPPVPPTLIAHIHDLALFRFANVTKSYSATLVDQDAGQTIQTFTLSLTTGVKYNILTVAMYEGYAETGSATEVQLGLSVAGGATDWGSSVSTENESTGIYASSALADYVATGDITVSVRARRQVATGQCWVRSGHAFAIAMQAETLGYILS